MTDFDYKKYSLENLENWLHDSMSAGEASPQEIYDLIVDVVKDNYYTYKQKTSEAYELLSLLNGNGGWTVEDVMKEREYYEPSVTSCSSDDPSPECQKSWTKFWEDAPYPVHVSEDGDMWIPDYVVKKDKIVRWQLPVEVDGLTGDCYVNFPDDLLEAANLKEGDQVEWIDNNDGSFTLKKVND